MNEGAAQPGWPAEARRFRRTAASLCVVSLLLASACVGLWTLSYARVDMVTRTTTDSEYNWLYAQTDGYAMLSLGNNHDAPTAFSHMALPSKQYNLGLILWLFVLGDPPSTGWTHAGVSYVQLIVDPGEQATWACIMPFWELLVVTLVYPAVWLLLHFRRSRRIRQATFAARGFVPDLAAGVSTEDAHV